MSVTLVDPSFLDTHRNFACPLCLDLLWEPVSTSCKHNFCKGCIERHFATAKTSCPLCRKELANAAGGRSSSAMMKTVTAWPECALSLLGNLQVHCREKEQGCEWKGAYEDVAAHQSRTCEWRMWTCPRCPFTVAFKDEQRKHHEATCTVSPPVPVPVPAPLSAALFQCNKCTEMLPADHESRDFHDLVFHSIPCPLQCGQVFWSHEDCTIHQEHGGCRQEMKRPVGVGAAAAPNPVPVPNAVPHAVPVPVPVPAEEKRRSRRVGTRAAEEKRRPRRGPQTPRQLYEHNCVGGLPWNTLSASEQRVWRAEQATRTIVYQHALAQWRISNPAAAEREAAGIERRKATAARKKAAAGDNL